MSESKRFEAMESGFISDKRDKSLLNLYDCRDLLNELNDENEQLRNEKQQYKTIAEQYRKTVQHQAELLADASKKGYCPKVINPITGEEL